jgi:hypothetical protein
MTSAQRIVVVTVAAVTLCLARQASADGDWVGTAGLGVTTVEHETGFFVDQALADERKAMTMTVGVQREFLGHLAVGLRAGYLHLDTTQAYYCRTTCSRAGRPARVHLFPITPTIEVHSRGPGYLLYAGAGYGPVWTNRAPKSDIDAAFQEVNRQAVVLAFGGLGLGASTARVRIEVCWRYFPRLILDYKMRSSVNGLELAVHLDLGTKRHAVPAGSRARKGPR